MVIWLGNGCIPLSEQNDAWVDGPPKMVFSVAEMVGPTSMTRNLHFVKFYTPFEWCPLNAQSEWPLRSCILWFWFWFQSIE